MKLSRIGIAVLAVMVPASVSFATLQTFATFADPAVGAGTPLFTLTYDQYGDITSVAGKWDGEGLTLQMHDGVIFEDAKFEIATVAVTSGQLGAGSLVFSTSDDVVIAVMTWTFGSINDFGLGASNRKMTVTNVQIENRMKNIYIYKDESFSFAFTNFVDNPDNNSATATASFTSSADIVTIPEPATMGLLALGSVVCFIRRTRG